MKIFTRFSVIVTTAILWCCSVTLAEYDVTMVKVINSSSSNPQYLTNVNGTLFS